MTEPNRSAKKPPARSERPRERGLNKEREPQITRLLSLWRDGDSVALSALMENLYPELRRSAQRLFRRGSPDRDLQPTAVVNEAFLRLRRLHQVTWEDRSHFLAVASSLMRKVLLDAHRAGQAQKRQPATANWAGGFAQAAEVETLDLLRAFDDLAEKHPRTARVAELRFLGGCTIAEAAASLGVSPGTIKNETAFAKAWMHRELGRSAQP